MILGADETLDTIHRLLTLYVPDSLDRQNVFDKLDQVGKKLLAPDEPKKCSKCGGELICPECDSDSISVFSEVSTSVRIRGKEIYV